MQRESFGAVDDAPTLPLDFDFDFDASLPLMCSVGSASMAMYMAMYMQGMNLFRVTFVQSQWGDDMVCTAIQSDVGFDDK